MLGWCLPIQVWTASIAILVSLQTLVRRARSRWQLCQFAAIFGITVIEGAFVRSTRREITNLFQQLETSLINLLLILALALSVRLWLIEYEITLIVGILLILHLEGELLSIRAILVSCTCGLIVSCLVLAKWVTLAHITTLEPRLEGASCVLLLLILIERGWFLHVLNSLLVLHSKIVWVSCLVLAILWEAFMSVVRHLPLSIVAILWVVSGTIRASFILGWQSGTWVCATHLSLSHHVGTARVLMATTLVAESMLFLEWRALLLHLLLIVWRSTCERLLQSGSLLKVGIWIGGELATMVTLCVWDMVLACFKHFGIAILECLTHIKLLGQWRLLVGWHSLVLLVWLLLAEWARLMVREWKTVLV